MKMCESLHYALYNYLGGGGQILVRDCKFFNHQKRVIILRHPDHTGSEKEIGTLYGTNIINCIFQNNGDSSAYGIELNGFSPIFNSCIFKNNKYPVYVRGFHAWPENQVYSNPAFISCVFVGNRLGIMIAGECTSDFVNCVFAANSSGGIRQGGMSGGGLTTLINCTITGNTTTDYYTAAGIDSGRSLVPPIIMSNCIVWGNKSGGVISAYTQINYGATIYSSTIQDDNEDGAYVYSGAVNPNITTYNCTDRNPQFVRNPYDGGDGWGIGDNDDYGDLRLSITSPCIDVGDNTAVPQDTEDIDEDLNTTEPVPWGLDKNPRFINAPNTDTGIGTPPLVDMGAYECQQRIPDFEPDGDVDLDDFSVFSKAWNTTPNDVHWNPECDLISDDSIDFEDLIEFSENWLFGRIQSIEVDASLGGSVLMPGEGVFEYLKGTTVFIEAQAFPNCTFSHWAGTAVEQGAVADPMSSSTTVAISGSFTLTAIFIARQEGLIGYWSFDEGMGSVAYDMSGSGYNGAIYGASWTEGVSDGALHFNGDNAYVNLTNNINPTSAMTISFWLKTNIIAQQGLVGKWRWSDGDYRSYYMQLYSSNKVQFFVSPDGTHTSSVSVLGTTSLATGTWYFITATYDGTNIKVYVNGSLENTQPYSSGLFLNTGTPMGISGQNIGGGTIYNYFNGNIDEARFYNRALSEAEIQSLYQNP